MKKIFYVVFLFAAAFVFLGGRQLTSRVSAQQSDAPAQQIQLEKDRILAEKVREITDRSTEDLPETVLPDGEVSIDLQDRLQNVMLSRIDGRAGGGLRYERRRSERFLRQKSRNRRARRFGAVSKRQRSIASRVEIRDVESGIRVLQKSNRAG